MAYDPRKKEPEQDRQARRGRPRGVVLSDAEVLELQRLYLATNRTTDKGSMTLAWDEFVRRHPGHKRDYSSKHTLPTAAREAMRVAARHVVHHRQGARKLRETTHQPGRLRLAGGEGRRLYAGERCSWDDATINLGVVIPWPQGGCPCSDRYGVKVGRFQLLLCHDDATGYIPSWSYVVRDAQGYRSEDVAAGMVRMLRDVCLYDQFIVEGGVWQSDRIKRLFDGIGLQVISAKGRPNQKLVEGFFNRLWTQLSLELPSAQVGRWRGEQKETSELYVACRGGRKDPRLFFPPLGDVMDAMERAIGKLNSRQIESRVYGKWIPEERWIEDMEAHPRKKLEGDWLWMAAPVVESRKVVNGQLKVTAPGPMGVKQEWRFSAPWLYEYAGEQLIVHFDPLSPAPVGGVVTAAKSGKRLGEVWCVNPISQGGTEEDIAKAQRDRMLREYRVMVPRGGKGYAELLVRDADRKIEVLPSRESSAAQANPMPAHHANVTRIGRIEDIINSKAEDRDREAADRSRKDRRDVADSVARRKARKSSGASLLW